MAQQPLTVPSQAETVAPPMNPIDSIAQSRVVHHLARLIGLAAAVAIGTVVVIWSSEPNYVPLYSNVSAQDSASMADVLLSREIKFKVDSATGLILVDQSRLADARLKLAAEGLPESRSRGLEMLQEDQSLGTSQFIEKARYNHALESELVRSIESIRGIETARVHLAIPAQSIFIRNRRKPSASVMVRLHAGHSLKQGQVHAIVRMVASSIAMMDVADVTVVDQLGRLLTADEDSEMGQTSKHFEYRRKLENNYVDRIIHLLQPIVGVGKVTAQVTAQLDFLALESTREAYDPEGRVIRSEQVSEADVRSLTEAIGIPGALSNQPPGAGTTEPTVALNDLEVGGEDSANQSRTATRNFEIDRTISHTRNPLGSIQRLSVAVVIDDRSNVKEDGSIEKVAYSAEKIASFVTLVKESIGFDEARGDSISVINTSFLEVPAPLFTEPPLWESILRQSGVTNLLKQILGAVGLLIVYLLFGRKILRALNPVRVTASAPRQLPDDSSQQTEASPGELAARSDFSSDLSNAAVLMRQKDSTYEQKIDMARNLVKEDPARVANVVKSWAGKR